VDSLLFTTSLLRLNFAITTSLLRYYYFLTTS